MELLPSVTACLWYPGPGAQARSGSEASPDCAVASRGSRILTMKSRLRIRHPQASEHIFDGIDPTAAERRVTDSGRDKAR